MNQAPCIHETPPSAASEVKSKKSIQEVEVDRISLPGAWRNRHVSWSPARELDEDCFGVIDRALQLDCGSLDIMWYISTRHNGYLLQARNPIMKRKQIKFLHMTLAGAISKMNASIIKVIDLRTSELSTGEFPYHVS